MRLAERTITALNDLLHAHRISHAGAARELGRSKAWVQRRLSGTVASDLNDLEDLAECAGMELRISFVPRGPE